MADDPSQTTPPSPTTPDQPAPVRPAAIGVRPAPFRPPMPAGAAPATGAGGPAGPATIRLKPVVPPAAVPAAPGGSDVAPTVRVKPVIPGQAAHAPAAVPPQPGSAPLPPGPKPLKPEQIQAAKAKTSRISLDAALIGGQDERGGPKTIRLKRPTDAPVGKITSHLGAAAAAATGQPPLKGSTRLSTSLVPPIPTEPSAPVVNRFTTSVEVPEPTVIKRSGAIETAEPTADAARIPLRGTAQLPSEASGEDSSITRRKTIRVKRPGAVSSTPASSADGATSDDTKPIVTTDMVPMLPAARMNPFFPVLAVLTIFILIALLIVFVAPDSRVGDGTAWPPNTPALKLPGMAPIPSRG